MNPVNKVLSLFGVRLSRVNKTIKQISNKEKEFRGKYEHYYKLAENNKRGFKTIKEYRYQVGEHPISTKDLEFEFVAKYLYESKPVSILDIGSYRHFILGLLAHYNVTTVDIRGRKSILENENVVTCNAKALQFSDNSFDAVVSLECLPHLGLLRYGDDFDLDADIKAFKEMIRVLKPGGLLVFSTAITGGEPTIAFNARRNYSYEMIRDLCHGLDYVEEKFINRRVASHCPLDEITTDPALFDYYIGCWRKK